MQADDERSTVPLNIQMVLTPYNGNIPPLMHHDPPKTEVMSLSKNIYHQITVWDKN